MIGWTVTACVPDYIQKRESIFKFHVATPEEDFNEKEKTQWQTESFGCRADNNTQRSVVDERVMNFLNKSIRKINDRYVVHLIWCDDNDNLPENLLLQLGDLDSLRTDLVLILGWLQITKLLTWVWKRDKSIGSPKTKQVP